MFAKKGSKILKLPPFRNCFTLAMTDKLVFIMNSLKVPKIKKILLYEMKFLVPNYSCLQNPWLGRQPPPDPCSLCPLSSTEFVEPSPHPPNKFPRYGTEPRYPVCTATFKPRIPESEAEVRHSVCCCLCPQGYEALWHVLKGRESDIGSAPLTVDRPITRLQCGRTSSSTVTYTTRHRIIGVAQCPERDSS